MSAGNNLKTLIFLTSSYPYLPGEQFIEDEIRYWAIERSFKTVVVPLTISGQAREIPESIDVNLLLANSNKLWLKLISLVCALFSFIFWKEVVYIFKNKGIIWQCYWDALRELGHVLRIRKVLAEICNNLKSVEVAYCYWNSLQCYAAVMLKKERLIEKVITRAHGFDLYEERRKYNYMPLKRQFIPGMDVVLTVASSAKLYFENNYLTSPSKVRVSRLGVPISEFTSKCSESTVLSIISLSYCITLKRVDKIIDALGVASELLNNKQKIIWTHIGDGPLYEELKNYAEKNLSPLGVEWRMLGSMPNSMVKEIFKTNSFDILLNVSDYEGVPVSIMEAMSYGIPVIAPNVGGIAEIVSSNHGFLLPQMPTVQTIAEAIVFMSSQCKEESVRARAKSKIIDLYSADKNYRSLIELIKS